MDYIQGQEILLDKIAIDQLKSEPYKEWYENGYSEYQVADEIRSELSQLNKGVKIEIYFGTWCADSRREVPRFLKIMDEIGVNKSGITLIGVDHADSVYKQSPSKTERELSIYRVPTFRILKSNQEIGRIVEYPIESLESDLLSILNGSKYNPNYRSFPIIDQWLADGILIQPNYSIRGLANQLRIQVYHFGEINSVAHVLLDQSRIDESITLYRINAYLFSDIASCLVMLARAYGKTGNIENALKVYRDAWELEPGDDDIFNELVTLARSQ